MRITEDAAMELFEEDLYIREQREKLMNKQKITYIKNLGGKSTY